MRVGIVGHRLVSIAGIALGRSLPCAADLF
jgi:hypothetical protein